MATHKWLLTYPPTLSGGTRPPETAGNAPVEKLFDRDRKQMPFARAEVSVSRLVIRPKAPCAFTVDSDLALHHYSTFRREVSRLVGIHILVLSAASRAATNVSVNLMG